MLNNNPRRVVRVLAPAPTFSVRPWVVSSAAIYLVGELEIEGAMTIQGGTASLKT